MSGWLPGSVERCDARIPFEYGWKRYQPSKDGISILGELDAKPQAR